MSDIDPPGGPTGDDDRPASPPPPAMPDTPPEMAPPPAPGQPPPSPSPAGDHHRPYAGFWPRLGALLLDGLILGVPFGIIWAILLVALPTEIELCTVDGQPGLCETFTNGSWAVIALVYLAYLAFLVFFWWGKLVGGRGQTPGRMAAGIKVVDRDTREPVGAGRAIGRGFFSIISAIICYIGYLWMLWDKDNQTLHDKVVNSVVEKE